MWARTTSTSVADRQRDRRQPFAEAHAVIDGGREGGDAELNREEQDQQVADEELRQRDRRQRDDVDDLVGQPVAELHGEHAERDRERHGDQRGEEGEEQRVSEPLADLFADRVLAGPGGAEIALDGAAEPVEVAFGQRLVEAEILADVFDRLRGRRLAEIGGGEIAGQGFDAAEDHQRHGKEETNAQAQALDDEGRQRAAQGETAPERAGRAARRGRDQRSGDGRAAEVFASRSRTRRQRRTRDRSAARHQASSQTRVAT